MSEYTELRASLTKLLGRWRNPEGCAGYDGSAILGMCAIELECVIAEHEEDAMRGLELGLWVTDAGCDGFAADRHDAGGANVARVHPCASGWAWWLENASGYVSMCGDGCATPNEAMAMADDALLGLGVVHRGGNNCGGV